MDVAPEPDGSEESPYWETIDFDAIGDVTNAESQTLAVLRYHQVVRRKSDDEIFHDQTGYWMWDAAMQTVAHSLAIPRAVCVVAGGRYTAPADASAAVVLEVEAKLGDADWGIAQSPFMRDKAKTVEFRYRATLEGDRLQYAETTVVEIYGRVFDHTDENELARV
ncbi:MAG: FABP family protein [Deltaproteobacteria bacterium]|nr:FABP family protein [Deltaproteobacteria bacterium]